MRATEIEKSGRCLAQATLEFERSCERLNQPGLKDRERLIDQMRTNLGLMRKVHDFLEWHAANPVQPHRFRKRGA